MPEYIEWEKLLNELQEELDFKTTMYTEEQNKWFNIGLKCAVRDVKRQPIVDVVKVVRCKDCEHCCTSTDPKTNISIQVCGYVGFNPVQSSQVSDDFYCSYGELKECEGK